MNFLRGQHKFLCSFCSSCVPTFLYDGRLHTDFEEERLREKKVFGMFSPSPAAHYREREKKYCVRNKNETVFKF